MPSRLSRLVSMLVSASVIASSSLSLAPAFAQTTTVPANADSTREGSGKVFNQQELDELLAPIALHPDALLAQILMASTYPLDVVAAARWRKANPKVADKALENAMNKEPWDPSVKSLVAFPNVLDMMNDKLEWTQKLGDAFLGQQAAVMDTVQSLRGKAKAAGNLNSSKEQKVSTTSEAGQTVIVVEPAKPDVVYVPTYNPTVVYGSWWYPAPPPYYWYPPHYVPGAALFTFTAGVIVGSWLWGGCHWGGYGHGSVNINVNNYNRVNNTNISNNQWNHNTDRRGGVPYASQGAREQYGNRAAQNRDTKSREEFRGRAESGRQEMGQNFDRPENKSRDTNRPSTNDIQDRTQNGNRASTQDRPKTADRGTAKQDRAQNLDRNSTQQRPTNMNHDAGRQQPSTSERGNAFSGMDHSSGTREASNRGSASRAQMNTGGAHASGGGFGSGGGARSGGGGGRGRR